MLQLHTLEPPTPMTALVHSVRGASIRKRLRVSVPPWFLSRRSATTCSVSQVGDDGVDDRQVAFEQRYDGGVALFEGDGGVEIDLDLGRAGCRAARADYCCPVSYTHLRAHETGRK